MKTRLGYYVLTTCFALWYTISSAQNLVPNGGFEQNAKCPAVPGDFTVSAWYSPTTSIPDYFNSCAPAYPNSSVSVPINPKGYQEAYNGNGYIGMEVLNMLDYTIASSALTRPYLQAHLSSPLVAGKMYTFEMLVSRADSFGLAAQVEACFTNAATRFPPFASDVTSASFILSDTGWTKITATVEAQGGEEYITIGNFHSSLTTAPLLYWIDPITTNSSSYYFFDDIKLEPCTSNVAGPFVKDTVFLCSPKDIMQLSAAGMGATKYQWNTGATTSSIQVTKPGKYIVTMDGINGFCTIIDSVIVAPSNVYTLELGPDKTICPNGNMTLSTTTPAIAYLWSTGYTSSSITVGSTGSYWLEVTSDQGCKNRDTIRVKNSPLVMLELGFDKAICENTPTTIDATIPGVTTYLWNTLQRTSSITINTAGTYKVTAIDSFCTVSDSITITTNPYPVINLGKDTALCKPDSLLLTAQANGAKYMWSTGNSTQSIYVNQTGNYIATVAKNGCVSRDTIKVDFNIMPVISLGNDTLICQGDNIKLDATTSGASYKWSTGSTSSFIYAFNPHKYTVEITRGACKTKDSITIYHQPKPSLDLGADQAICTGQEKKLLQASMGDKYLWQNGSKGNTFMVETPGIYWVEVTKTVCHVRDSIVITAKPIPVVNLGNDLILCKESSKILNAGNPGSSFRWNTTATSQAIRVYPPGCFKVTVTNPQGCVATDSISLDTFISPTVSLGPDSFICEGSSLMLDAGLQFAEYIWQDGKRGHRYEATQPGTYAVKVKDEHQCTAFDKIELGSRPKPVIQLASEITMCDPDFVLSLPQPYVAYQWQDGSTAPTMKVKSYGQYSVTVTDANYCTNSASVEIKNNCAGTVYVPNAFTPLNRDGVNDTFYPIVKNVKEMNFQVYNRWGQLLFETSKLNEGWTGSHQNEYSLSDVYIYKVSYIGMDDQAGVISGSFTLLK